MLCFRDNNTRNYANRKFERIRVLISQITIIFFYNLYNRVKITMHDDFIRAYRVLRKYHTLFEKREIFSWKRRCLFLIFSV